jgi:hypothetical protein
MSRCRCFRVDIYGHQPICHLGKKKRQAADEFVQERYRRGLKLDFVPDTSEPIDTTETARAEDQLLDEHTHRGASDE